jgi:hypothetical protein
MTEERINPKPQEGVNGEGNENMQNVENDRFESDTQKIVRRHLENEDDVITDEDIANVRIGMTPPQFDEATEARFEGNDAREEAEKELLSGTENMEKDENLDEEQITPWDTIEPDK